MCDEITYPSPNFKCAAIEVWEWISKFIPHLTEPVITYPMLGLKWTHIDKKGPWYIGLIEVTPVASCHNSGENWLCIKRGLTVVAARTALPTKHCVARTVFYQGLSNARTKFLSNIYLFNNGIGIDPNSYDALLVQTHFHLPVSLDRLHIFIILIHKGLWHIHASVDWFIIVSGNGWSPVLRQAITWTNADLSSTGLSGTNPIEVWIGVFCVFSDCTCCQGNHSKYDFVRSYEVNIVLPYFTNYIRYYHHISQTVRYSLRHHLCKMLCNSTTDHLSYLHFLALVDICYVSNYLYENPIAVWRFVPHN